MTEAVPRAGRAAWEARMTALYGRAVHILEYTRSGERAAERLRPRRRCMTTRPRTSSGCCACVLGCAGGGGGI